MVYQDIQHRLLYRKFVKKKDYDNNYKEILKDEKIKMLFFINSPNIKKNRYKRELSCCRFAPNYYKFF